MFSDDFYASPEYGNETLDVVSNYTFNECIRHAYADIGILYPADTKTVVLFLEYNTQENENKVRNKTVINICTSLSCYI